MSVAKGNISEQNIRCIKSHISKTLSDVRLLSSVKIGESGDEGSCFGYSSNKLWNAPDIVVFRVN